MDGTGDHYIKTRHTEKQMAHALTHLWKPISQPLRRTECNQACWHMHDICSETLSQKEKKLTEKKKKKKKNGTEHWLLGMKKGMEKGD
jgi:hypothetical protein